MSTLDVRFIFVDNASADLKRAAEALNRLPRGYVACCPTEAQVHALLQRHASSELLSYCEWSGLTPFEAVEFAVTHNGAFDWHDLFYDTACALAQGFDTWRDEFRDVLNNGSECEW